MSFLTTLIGTTALLLLLLLIRYAYRIIKSPLMKMPGPKMTLTNLLFGYVPMIRKEPFMVPHERWWKQFGHPSVMCYHGVLSRPTVLILSPDGAKAILAANQKRYPKQLKVLAMLLGQGLVTLEGDEWATHRRLIQPSFSTSYVRDLMNENVPRRMKRLETILSTLQPDTQVDCLAMLNALTLDVIGEAAFSHKDFHGIDAVETWAKNTNVPLRSNNKMLNLMHKSLIPNIREMFLLVLGMFPKNVNSPLLSSARKETTLLLNKAVDEIVSDARERLADASDAKSILQCLFNARDEEDPKRTLGNSELRDEVKTFLLAGHETTATLLNWCMYVLSTNERGVEFQQRLYDEVIDAFGNDDDITAKEVDSLPFMDHFIHEVLRLYSPVGMILRHTAHTETIEGYEIPKGTRIIIPLYLIHRHPKYWPQAEVFRPERWEEKAKHAFAFIPFSAGGRNCIGQKFAMYEGKMMLAALIRRFRVRLSDALKDVAFEYTSQVTMKPKPDLKINFLIRK